MSEWPEVEIWCDGSALTLNGPGGWGAVLKSSGKVKKTSGRIETATSQQAEIAAAIGGLFALRERSRVIIYSDSAYLVNAVNKGHLKFWEETRYKKSQGGAIRHAEDWETLKALMEVHCVEFVKVWGHTGMAENEEAHRLANLAAHEEAKYQNKHIPELEYKEPEYKQYTIQEAIEEREAASG